MEALKVERLNPVEAAFCKFDKNKEQRDRYEPFSSAIRDITLYKHQEICKGSKVDLLPCQDPFSSIFGHWMTLIIISGKKLKICLKTHFNTAEGFYLLEQSTIGRKKRSEADLLRSFDFMKELSNEVAGRIKSSLGSENSAIGLSLPLLTRGFDEVLFIDRIIKANKGEERARETWSINCNGHLVTYTAEVQVLEWDVFNDLQTPQEDSAGNTEFL
ncbi:hypothetical protein [Pseudobacteriovorax antillogorgiicola]|uniref:Uncharacterized protein n=1 Tax=Pseudobacteriovorax antillogorgiicola TaxID=1513793 RepID=A0A1Y6BDE8_9BACT|nr:hypothetical protein [Pseudobacteriovorax antillogorgiicola]TCS58505.1 hypothetical protein EDD56_10218 [Pseudobacteriovorax antillogorgiicola]SME98162.1 hypothetical protein SAMN06296036_102425 [Pseudobacteriovorax antillogorgiicola]